MNTKNVNKALRDIKSIRMSEAEKATMVARIMSTPVDVSAPVQYPYPYFGIWQPMFRYVRVSYYWTRRHSTSSFFAAIFAVVLIGGGVAVAAQDSLPGSSLYSLKINVIEPARQAMALSDHARAQVAADLAGERLQEAATLAVRGDLDAAKQAELQNSIEAQTAVFASAVSDVRAHNPDLAEKDSAEFQASMDTHAESLATLARGKTSGDDANKDSSSVTTVLAVPMAVTQAVMTKTISIPSAAASSSEASTSKPISAQRVAGSPLIELSQTARDAAQSIHGLQR